MSTSRRNFFKRLAGGVGALSLGGIILSKRGWFGLPGPAEAFAQPGRYYELRSGFTFFEGYRTGPPSPSIPAFIKGIYRVRPNDEQGVLESIRQRVNKLPPRGRAVRDMGENELRPQIVDHNASPKQTYELSDEAAYITRLLLVDVDVNSLASMYASRYNLATEAALQAVNSFINNNPFFQVKAVVGQPHQTPRVNRKNFTEIWADFSIGSVWVSKVSSFPA
ncbi:MAG: twin-arginine translocation signal domain-containing protein [Deltaproteobacteria bacterium]|nr:twin-arginine translocation signal domain-containing protein [Deltaproteobacteria bacterium]